jgi:hypothetical protein
MKIATINLNNIKRRLPNLAGWPQDANLDICLSSGTRGLYRRDVM